MSQITSAIPSAGPGSGTVTSVAAAGGLTAVPNPIIAAGTVLIDQTNLTVLDGTVYWNTGTQRLNTTATGTSGFVLTSQGAGLPPIYAAIPVSGIQTIQGDTGSVTGTTVSIKGNATSGSSVLFNGSGTAMTFNVSDINDNTLIGASAGNGTLSGIRNTGLGFNVLNAVTTGEQNTCIGFSSGSGLLTGELNTLLGVGSGQNYTGAESGNININTAGVPLDANCLRIGNGTGGTGQSLIKAFISGINGVTTSNSLMVTINSVTDQLGVAAVPSGNISITGDSGGALVGNAFTFTGGTTGLTFSGSGTTETLTGTLVVSNGGTGRATLTNHGVLVGAGTSAITQLAVGTTGQVLTGVTGADPVFAAAAFVAFPWTDVTGASVALAINNGYTLNRASAVTATLPSTATYGSIIEVVAINTGLGSIAQNANQTIWFSTVTKTTTGVTGSLTFTSQYGSIRLLCTTADTDFTVLNSSGSFTIV